MMHKAERALILDLAERMIVNNRQALILLEARKPGRFTSVSVADAHQDEVYACRRDLAELEKMVLAVRALDRGEQA